MAQKCVLVIEPSILKQREITGFLSALQVRTLVAQDGNQALAHIDSGEPDVIFCNQEIQGHRPSELCEYVHDFIASNVSFVLVVPKGQQDPERVGKEAGADLVLVEPLDEQRLTAACTLLFKVNDLKTRLSHILEENLELRKLLRSKLQPDPETHFYRFDLFKQIILLEIKKARRYGYPVSLLLFAIDNYQKIAGWLSSDQRKKLYELLNQAVTKSIREIDIPLLFAEDKILVVLPHTPLKNSILVSDRIRDRVSEIDLRESMAEINLSVSAAVASTEGEQKFSFGKIVQKAMRGLKEAEMKGGNVVIVCRSASQERTSEEQELVGIPGSRIFYA